MCVYAFSSVWEFLPRTHKLLESMRKHKASAKCIKIKGIDKECVIASSDGACIIWDPVEARTRPLNPFCFFPAETNSQEWLNQFSSDEGGRLVKPCKKKKKRL